MVRKRGAYTRWRSKRTRTKTPAPKNGWRIAELSQLSQVPVSRVRHYVELDLLEPPEFRGTATRYPRRALLRLLAIVRLRAEGRFRLIEIKQRLDALGDKELEAWAAVWVVAAHTGGGARFDSNEHDRSRQRRRLES